MKRRLLGLSRDGRTNRWMITCECGREFEPTTTMRRYQEVMCPKCNATEIQDYNRAEGDTNVPTQ